MLYWLPSYCRLLTGSCRPFQRSAQMQYMYELGDDRGELFVSVVCISAIHMMHVTSVIGSVLIVRRSDSPLGLKHNYTVFNLNT